MATNSFDVLDILVTKRAEWEHIESACQAIDDVSLTLKRKIADGYCGDLYRTDYVVEGRDEFPFDMLRYTQSWPKDETASWRMSSDRLGSDESEYREITLSKFHRDPQPVLSEARWESKFRWRVVRIIETVAV